MHLQLVELENDKKRLKAIDPIAGKVKLKRDDLLPKWLPHVDEYLAQVAKGEPSYDHPIFAYCVIWLFDSGDYDRAIQYAFKAIELQQPSPLKRGWPSFVANTVYDWAEAEAENGHSIEPYFSTVFNQVTSKWELHEALTAKYYKLAGLQFIRDKTGKVKATNVGDVEALTQADELLEKAQQLYRNIGVKTIRDKIAQRLRGLEG
ncbi:MAG: phage terminase small subunit [Parashewanella sp.]